MWPCSQWCSRYSRNEHVTGWRNAPFPTRSEPPTGKSARTTNGSWSTGTILDRATVNRYNASVTSLAAEGRRGAPVPDQPTAYTTPGLSLRGAAAIFAGCLNARLIAAALAVAVVARLALGGWSGTDAIVAAGVPPPRAPNQGGLPRADPAPPALPPRRPAPHPLIPPPA